MSTKKQLALDEIIRDEDIQSRAEIDKDAIARYMQSMKDGDLFPAARVFYDGEKHWLSQGFHRIAAAEQAGVMAIEVEVVRGTRSDAIWDAACSNRDWDKSGKPRTNKDKRRAVTMALKVRPNLSTRAIAEEIGVSNAFVSKMRSGVNVNTPPGTGDGQLSESYGNGQSAEGPQGGNRADQESGDQSDSPSEEAPPFALSAEVKPQAKSTFNLTNENVDWARWTWNPVTGCEHNCYYCYARDIANRFYPEKFEPTYRPERLEAPRNTKLPEAAIQETDPVQRMGWRNVFVCSMADLFGRWVPDEWIAAVFDSCQKSPEWNYLFLTKFPQRYVDLDFPSTSWVGTTVDEQKRVKNAEKAFANITAPVKWLSCEPMLEPLEFEDLSVFDWIVIGGCSESTGGPKKFPDSRWVVKLINQAIDSGCKIYCKKNISVSSGFAAEFKEYPDIYFG